MPVDRKDWEGKTVLELLELVLSENKVLNENLSSVQGRSTELLERVRRDRKTIVELGGKDPGPP